MNTFDPRSRKFYIFALSYWIAVIFALFLWSRDWGFLRGAIEDRERLFELFGFCIFFILIFAANIDLRNYPNLSLRNIILIWLPFFVSLFFLSLVIEMSHKSWDYKNYENAFKSVLIGNNPYQSMHSLYPPPFAKSMVIVYRLGKWLYPLLNKSVESSSLWGFVFFVHQSSLLFFLLYSYHLSLRFARIIGISTIKSSLFVSALFIFNVPILRTISYNQVNFYVVVSILLSMILFSNMPYISGIAIAIGGLIKLFPFVIVLPSLGLRKWKVILGVSIGGLVIILLQTNYFQDFLLWKQFILFYTSFPVGRESSMFRSTSPLSFIRNLISLINLPSTSVLLIYLVLLFVILGWYATRFAQREKIYSLAISDNTNLLMNHEIFRNIGHLVDFSVLSLLLSPSAWEHHYVIAIPLGIWIFAIHSRDFSALAGIGLLFVFLLPVYNFFPFSYLRVLGLIILLFQSSPKLIQNRWNN